MHCTAYGPQVTHRQNSRKRRQGSITPTLHITVKWLKFALIIRQKVTSFAINRTTIVLTQNALRPSALLTINRFQTRNLLTHYDNTTNKSRWFTVFLLPTPQIRKGLRVGPTNFLDSLRVESNRGGRGDFPHQCRPCSPSASCTMGIGSLSRE